MKKSSTAKPTFPLTPAQVAKVLGHQTRWAILYALGGGEALPVRELARRARTTAGLAGKHADILEGMGVVRNVYGRLKQIVPSFQPAPGSDVIDLGSCLIRIPAKHPATVSSLVS